MPEDLLEEKIYTSQAKNLQIAFFFIGVNCKMHLELERRLSTSYPLFHQLQTLKEEMIFFISLFFQ